jgi:hypothetical protein
MRCSEPFQCECRTWEVIGCLDGHCVYVKSNLTADEANHFLYNAIDEDGNVRYFWPDGEGIITSGRSAAFWKRQMKVAK